MPTDLFSPTQDELPCKDKMVFSTKKEAEAVATTLKFSRGTKLKAYLCTHCQLWHLSSDY